MPHAQAVYKTLQIIQPKYKENFKVINFVGFHTENKHIINTIDGSQTTHC